MVTRLLRALDAAVTTFVNTLWPLPDAPRLDETRVRCSQCNGYAIGDDSGDYWHDLECPAVLDAGETDFDEAAAEKYLAALPGLRPDLLKACGLDAPTEPPLTGDELVCVRQLIEERFDLPVPADSEASAASGPAAGNGPASPPTFAPGGDAGYPVIDPGHLSEAASLLLCFPYSTDQQANEIHALATRLIEYAEAIRTLDSCQ